MAVEVVGASVTPHVSAKTLKFFRPAVPSAGALVRLIVRGSSPFRRSELLIEGENPAERIASGAWGWCDFPHDAPDASVAVAPGQLTVLTFNALQALPESVMLQWDEDKPGVKVALKATEVSIAAATFLGESVQPDRLVLHLENKGNSKATVESVRLWLPPDPKLPNRFAATPALAPSVRNVPAQDFIALTLETGKLPLTYCLIEVKLSTGSLWAHQRIKREAFDLSGGWVGEKYLTEEPYLRALKSVHINAAHIPLVPGYSDTGLSEKYPLKHFHGCQPVASYDNERVLPRVHAVEFLGEPQYGGRKGPTPPQEVWGKLAPFATSRLATTVTWSDPRGWCRYAGISDFPHYDAYRVCAPATDSWRSYEWPGGVKISWGAPLETIGELCRSLRECYKPAPTAYWSQGPHDDWKGWRPRGAPTPDELRLQAYHALASRITSLYWFNLKPISWVLFPDTFAEMQRIGREIRLLESYYLEGAATHFAATKDKWELSVIAAPRGAVCLACDNAYTPDVEKKVFVFGAPRTSTFNFPLPDYLKKPTEVVRVDADGIVPVRWRATKTGIEIKDTQSRVAVYITSAQKGLAERLEQRRQVLITEEARFDFNPGSRESDREALRQISEKKPG